MSPLVPKRQAALDRRPGHIHDAPGAAADAGRAGAASGSTSRPRRSRCCRRAEEEREPQGEPAPVPEPSEVEVPRALAQEIRRAMKRYPQKRSAAMPALWAVQRRYGWCTPGGDQPGGRGDGGDARLPGGGRDLLRPLPPRARGRAPGARLHQHQLLAARRRPPARSVHEAGGCDSVPGSPAEDGKLFDPGLRVPRRLRHRADGLDRRALLRAARRGRRGGRGRAAALRRKEVLPEKRLEDRKLAGGPDAREVES